MALRLFSNRRLSNRFLSDCTYFDQKNYPNQSIDINMFPDQFILGSLTIIFWEMVKHLNNGLNSGKWQFRSPMLVQKQCFQASSSNVQEGKITYISMNWLGNVFISIRWLEYRHFRGIDGRTIEGGKKTQCRWALKSDLSKTRMAFKIQTI